MRYIGGKSRTARRIVAAIMDHARSRGPLTRWVEPFMGGGSTMVAASRLGVFNNVHASDIDPLVVAYWTAIRDGWVPVTDVTYEEYVSVRDAPEHYALAHVAHVAYNCSFGGKRWGGFARGKKENGDPRNFADESSRRDTATAPYLAWTTIACTDYAGVLSSVGPGDVVYCDPPYQGTTGYATGAFDHAGFWDAASSAVNRGALVYVSEYAHPDHIRTEAVWSSTQAKSVAGGSGTRPRATDNVFFVIA